MPTEWNTTQNWGPFWGAGHCKSASSTTSSGRVAISQSAHKSPEFRKEWGQFDQLADEIDPHLYEVTHVMDSRE